MSSPPPSRDPDELASALLDGELTPAEARTAAGDPAVQQRLAVLRATRDALRAADPAATGDAPRVEQRAAAIDRALAAFEAEGDARAPHAPADDEWAPASTSRPGVSDPLRRIGGSRPVRWFAAAAAVVVLAGMVALISLASEPETTDDTAAQGGAVEGTDAADRPATEAPEAGGSGAADQEEDGSGGQAAREAADDLAGPTAGPVDLGTLPSTDVLVARAGAAVDEAGAPPPATGRAPSIPGGSLDERLDAATCDAARTSGQGPLAGTPPLLEMTAVMDGRRLLVWAYADGPDLRIVALDEGCRPVVDRVVAR